MIEIYDPNAGVGGGGDPISNPSVAYVRSDGDDGTAEIGNPGKPYLTAQAAWAAGARVLHLGVGEFEITGTDVLDGQSLVVFGEGIDKTTLDFSWTRPNGTPGTVGSTGTPSGAGGVPGGDGGAGTDATAGDSIGSITISSDHTANININLAAGHGAVGGVGGTGGAGGEGPSGGYPGGLGGDAGASSSGGSIGPVTVRHVTGTIVFTGGNGADAAQGGQGGAGGNSFGDGNGGDGGANGASQPGGNGGSVEATLLDFVGTASIDVGVPGAGAFAGGTGGLGGTGFGDGFSNGSTGTGFAGSATGDAGVTSGAVRFCVLDAINWSGTTNAGNIVGGSFAA